MATKVDIARDGSHLYATVIVPPGSHILPIGIQRRASGAVTGWVKAHDGLTANKMDRAPFAREFRDGAKSVTFYYTVQSKGK